MLDADNDSRRNPIADREKPKLALSEALHDLENGANHPDYPENLRRMFYTFTKNVTLHDDLAFTKRAQLANQTLHPNVRNKYQNQIINDIGGKEAFVIPARGSRYPTVIVRESYGRLLAPRLVYRELMAEEFAHTTAQTQKRLQIKNIPKNSHMLDGLEDAVKYTRSAGLQSFSPSEISIWGYSSRLTSGKYDYVGLQKTSMYEELRAQLIATHLLNHWIMITKKMNFEEAMMRHMSIYKDLEDERKVILIRLGNDIGWQTLIPTLVGKDVDAFWDLGSSTLGEKNFQQRVHIFSAKEMRIFTEAKSVSS